MPFRVRGMRVLAIDPGYGRCGIALIERNGMEETLRYSACIETPSGLDFTERLRLIIDHIERVMVEHKPVVLAIEKLYFKANRTSAMRVAEVRGAILAAASARGMAVHEYGPGEVKVAIAGDGRADKKQVARMIHLLMKVDGTRIDDEYDAIAIGLAHLAVARTAGLAVQSATGKRPAP